MLWCLAYEFRRIFRFDLRLRFSLVHRLISTRPIVLDFPFNVRYKVVAEILYRRR